MRIFFIKESELLASTPIARIRLCSSLASGKPRYVSVCTNLTTLKVFFEVNIGNSPISTFYSLSSALEHYNYAE